MKKIFLGLVWAWLLLSTHYLQASHNLAGQIVAVYQGNNTYEITLTTYTDPAPANVDRCSADIEIWTVGGNPIRLETLEDVPRANGMIMSNPPNDCTIPPPVRNGLPVYGTVKRNIYVTTYTFPGPGRYELRYQDVARREDIINMSDPGSTAFYVETQIFIPNPIIGENNTPVLLNDPLDEACAGKLWSHNPGGNDPDGDSLVYRLRPSFQYDPPQNIPPTPVNNYRFPDDAAAFGNGPLTQDPVTGLMTWEVPNQLGTYNVAYIVEEYRNGVLLGYVIRDMAIFVRDCDNDPPVIETIEDTCITAGETLTFDLTVYDPNGPDSVYLELNNGGLGANGPFSNALPNPATARGLIIDQFTGNFPWGNIPVSTRNNISTIDTISGTVTWNSVCDNIRTQPFQIDFFAHDNNSYIESPSLVRLTDNAIVRIEVVPPPASFLSISKERENIVLDWVPSLCDNAVGYRIYRRLGQANWMQDTICCEMSPVDAGYEEIAFVAGWDNTSFRDSLADLDIIFNEDICYVVTAMYGDVSARTIPTIESCATNEACIQLSNDRIYMTNDSVAVTDTLNGEIFLSWSRPDSIDRFFIPPYQYRLLRGPDTEAPIDTIGFFGLDDTTFTDTGLNTEDMGFNYRVDLVDGKDQIITNPESREEASSIYLQTFGGNNTVNLSWKEVVSWTNTEYKIYRSEDGGPFVLLDSIVGTGDSIHNYVDAGLAPDIEYCYFIRSEGSHNVAGVKPLLINDSQISCSLAIDNIPPCNPQVVLSASCDSLIHRVRILKNMDVCEDDGLSITVLFARNQVSDFNPIATLRYDEFGTDTTLIFTFAPNSDDFGGCYAVTAVDTVGNTSELSNAFCVDFCPGLMLGNIFTPNADGVNDFFTPVFQRDIQLRIFKVFDRWGREVHSNTTDILRLWDGNISFSNQGAPEGVYYYYIRYEEIGINENTTREARGSVTLLR